MVLISPPLRASDVRIVAFGRYRNELSHPLNYCELCAELPFRFEAPAVRRDIQIYSVLLKRVKQRDKYNKK